jgi:EAL domain-containing protein (putative c-di-GMP-specific phosphodiesterase class I)/DNA-binding NarL/FixJ family response regulator
MNESPYRNLTVLVADDSRSMRELIVAILQAEGVRKILQAEDGEGVMRALNTPGQAVDLVFCDLAMPGTDGVETMRRIAASRLEPAIALISGYDQKLLHTVSDMTSELGLRVVGTLCKPFTPEDVSELLKEFLLTRRIYRSRQGFSITVEELDDALEKQRVEVYYQPKVRLDDGQLVGVEALVRIVHPAFGVLEPDQFIPVAESSGRITPLTMIVLQKSIAQAGNWQRDGLDIGVAINMSTLAIRRLDLPEIVAEMAAKAGVPNDRITIELTESQVAEGPEMLHILSRFRLRGFNLSIDDYGTGQSGLQRLKRLPFTELKIDKAFVNGASRDADMRSILEVSIELGRRLRMEVVAEGVENWLDWRLLKRLGCDMAQGFVIARPVPAAGIGLWAQSWQAPL